MIGWANGGRRGNYEVMKLGSYDVEKLCHPPGDRSVETRCQKTDVRRTGEQINSNEQRREGRCQRPTTRNQLPETSNQQTSEVGDGSGVEEVEKLRSLEDEPPSAGIGQ
ncbi:MAG: hypothetical protein ACLFWL_08475 [Candidatus Brocadiia bacterium]